MIQIQFLLILMSILENTYKNMLYYRQEDKIISKKNFLRLKESHKEINFYWLL